MTVGFILNGEDVVVQTTVDKRLLDILRDTFKLFGTKSGCRNGRCGSCSIIFNGKVVPSCMIPSFQVRGGEVITIEGFSQTDEYQDIITAFSRAGVETCGYCTSAKILSTEALLEQTPQPSLKEALSAFDGVICRCTEPESLSQAVLIAADIRQRRRYGRTS